MSNIVIVWDPSIRPLCLPNGRCVDCDHYIKNGKPHTGSCIKRKVHVKNDNGCEYFADIDFTYA